MLKKYALLLFIGTAFSIVASGQAYYPDSTWQKRQPQAVNMNKALVDSAVSFALRNEVKLDYDLRIANMKSYASEPDYRILGPTRHRGKPAGLIIKNGYIVGEWGDCNRVDMTFSVTKSYLSSVAGLAADQGLIRTIEDPLHQYVWDETFQGPHNEKIRWRHLLDQSSGWSGCQFGICDWADRPPRTGTIDDWRNRKLVEPGTVFEYNDVRVNLLAYALLQVWRKPLPQVLREKIMDPIGASPTWRWYGYETSFVNMDGIMIQSVSGGGHFGGGLFINTYDHARFGLLFCRKGKWRDKQLLSESWVRKSREPSKPNPEYGLMWWLNTGDEFPGVSRQVYYAAGYGGNYIVVDEEHDLVIVTRWLDTSKLPELVKMVVNAVNK